MVTLDLTNTDATKADLVVRDYDSAYFSNFFDVALNKTDAGNHIDLFDLDSRFGNIFLPEYWFGGDNGPACGNVPTSRFFELKLEIDNVEFGPAIPISAAVYLFGSGLIGLVSVGRRRSLLACNG